MKIVIAFTLLALMLSVALCDNNKNQARLKFKQNEKWKSFKLKHLNLKSYASDDDEEASFNEFMKTDELIEKNKQEYHDGLVPFELDHNGFSALTPSERKNLNGLIPPPRNSEKRRRFAREASFSPSSAQLASVPTAFDWTAQGWNVTVRDQKSCGSCWAFAACQAMEAAHWIGTGEVASCGPQFAVSCALSPTYQTFGCNGGWYGDDFKFTMDQGGYLTEDSYTYSASETKCKDTSSLKKVFKVKTYQRVKSNAANLKAAIVNQGPVVTCIYGSGLIQSYSKGVFRDDSIRNNTEKGCNHAVLIVGYGVDAESGLEFWKLKNSWGPKWGEGGYIRMINYGIDYPDMMDYNVVLIGDYPGRVGTVGTTKAGLTTTTTTTRPMTTTTTPRPTTTSARTTTTTTTPRPLTCRTVQVCN